MNFSLALTLLLGSALLTSALAEFFYRLFLIRGVLDKPNARSSHTTSTVRGPGGSILVPVFIALFLGCIYGEVYSSIGIFVGVFCAAAVSLIDDFRSLSQVIRLFFHFIASTLFLAFLDPNLPFNWIGEGLGPTVIAYIGMCLWLVGFTNSFNFMDGINGIAVSQIFLTSIGSLVIIVCKGYQDPEPFVFLPLVLIGAAVGFLPKNFPTARMFMGDFGSIPVGFTLAAVSLWVSNSKGWDLLVPFVLLQTNFWLDTGLTLLRRIVCREEWWRPHREHFYQRLIRSGASHSFVTTLEFFGQVVTVLLIWAYVTGDPTIKMVSGTAIVLLWLGFFTYCELKFRKRTAV